MKVKVIMNWDNNREEIVDFPIERDKHELEEQLELRVGELVEKKYGIYDVKEFVILD